MSIHPDSQKPRHWRQNWWLVGRSGHSQGVGRSRQPNHKLASQTEQPRTDTHREKGSNFRESQSCSALVMDSSATPLFPAHPVFNTFYLLGFSQLDFQRIFCHLAEEKIVWRETFLDKPRNSNQGSTGVASFEPGGYRKIGSGWSRVSIGLVNTCSWERILEDLVGSFAIWAESAEATEDWAVEAKE